MEQRPRTLHSPAGGMVARQARVSSCSERMTHAHFRFPVAGFPSEEMSQSEIPFTPASPLRQPVVNFPVLPFSIAHTRVCCPYDEKQRSPKIAERD